MPLRAARSAATPRRPLILPHPAPQPRAAHPPSELQRAPLVIPPAAGGGVAVQAAALSRIRSGGVTGPEALALALAS